MAEAPATSPGSKSKHYQRIQSWIDRIKDELEALENENRELRARLAALEGREAPGPEQQEASKASKSVSQRLQAAYQVFLSLVPFSF